MINENNYNQAKGLPLAYFLFFFPIIVYRNDIPVFKSFKVVLTKSNSLLFSTKPDTFIFIKYPSKLIKFVNSKVDFFSCFCFHRDYIVLFHFLPILFCFILYLNYIAVFLICQQIF
ncbi:hypothetical protein Alsa3_CDS0039 [Staphylococcus phage Alsa_3]|nr:hypothetical protein Alsa3_CDS0039 [Staphylococcus phage Alsa_3]WNM51160.1 hypothetical protein Alsa4_CDS0030 [Staphylococcus phage Alsa_4]